MNKEKMTLNEWMRSKNKSVSSFSKEIGVREKTIYRYLSGERRPKANIIEKISEVTNEMVTADSFYMELSNQ